MFDEVAVAVCDEVAVAVCDEDDATCAISMDICGDDGPACDKEYSACDEKNASFVDNDVLVASNAFLAFSMRCCRVAVLMPYLSAALRIDKVFDNTSRIASLMFSSLILFLSVLGLYVRTIF